MQLLLEIHTDAPLAVATSAALTYGPAASDGSQIPLLAQRNPLLSISARILPQEQWSINISSFAICTITLHLVFSPYHAA